MLKVLFGFFFCFYISALFAQVEVEEKIAIINNLGYNVTNCKVNERKLAKARTYISDPKDILVLGSSRVRKLNHDFFENEKVLNLGMSGAILQDLIAVYYNVEKYNTKPKIVYLGIDPWLLNNADSRWKVLIQDYNCMKKKLEHIPVNDTIYESALDKKLSQIYSNSLFKYTMDEFTEINESFSYLMTDLNMKKAPKDTLKFINKKIKDYNFYDLLSENTEFELDETGKMLVEEKKDYRGRIPLFFKRYQKINIRKLNINILTVNYGFPMLQSDGLIITKKMQTELNTIEYDGSIIYNRAFETYNERSINTSVQNYIKKPYKLSKNQKTNNANKKLFEVFVKHLIDNNIEVKFVLIPFHTTLYNSLSSNNDYAFLNEFELYIKEFAAERNIVVFGSYNPDENNLETEDFYDAMHIRPSGLRKVMLLVE
jgi:hypothetical protein